jgi:hypothetical protein
VVVGDDEDPFTDPGARGRRSERLRARKRMTPMTLDREIGEGVDSEEDCSRNVRLEIRLPPGFDSVERVRAVDEAILDQ